METQSYDTPDQSQSYFFDGTIILSDEHYKQLWERANTRYTLDDAFNQSVWSQCYTKEVTVKGFCLPIGGKYRVYSGPLAALLTGGTIPVTVNRKEGSVTWETVSETETCITQRPIVTRNRTTIVDTIQGDDFAAIYRNGYDQGIEWFNDNYGDNRSIASALNGPNAQSYIADLHTLSAHNPGTAIYKGMMPNPVTHYLVWQIGFNSGINTQLDSLKEKRPALFNDIKECRHREVEVDGLETTSPDQDTLHEGVAGAVPISQRALALFVWYCQETGEYPKFEKMEEGFKAVTKPYGSAWKPFQQHYNGIPKNRHNSSWRLALEEAIKYLKKSGVYRKALDMAESDLRSMK